MFDLIRAGTASAKNDILSGITVALALIPEAVAFAFVAGVEPLVGLYAAFMVGLITAVIGGRPGMISGATGALAVVMVALVAQHGVEYLFATVVLMGLLQVLAGLLKLGMFIRMVPYPVMLGFVNGLAIVIFLAQLGQFKVPDGSGALAWMQGEQLWWMLGLVALAMAIIHFLPKLTRAIPSSLVAIATITAIVAGTDIPVPTVVDFLRNMTGDLNATIEAGLPSFHIPMVPLNWQTLTIIFPYAMILAAIGLIESLLTLSLVDELTQTRGRGNVECVGQGVANIATGFFGGMGGCAMIGQSMININSGGRGRLSGITAAVGLLLFILFAAEWIEMIPLAALVGVMFMVVLGTFEWATFNMIRKVPRSDMFIIVLVTGVTVAADLAIAVFVGVIASALRFAWQHATEIRSNTHIDSAGAKIYELHGPLFFGSTHHFLTLFDVAEDPNEVIIDFIDSRLWDQSAVEAVDTLAERYLKAGKQLHLRHLASECRQLLHTAADLVEVNMIEDPDYHIASRQLG